VEASSEHGLSIAVAAAGVAFALFGAISSCGEPFTEEPYGSTEQGLQYYDAVEDCRIERLGREHCCVEIIQPRSIRCPTQDSLSDEGEAEAVTTVCARRADQLRIEWQETDQFGNPYEPCGVEVTEHRQCRCELR